MQSSVRCGIACATLAMVLTSPGVAAAQAPSLIGPGSPVLANRGLAPAADTMEAFNVRGGERRPAGLYVERTEHRIAPNGRAEVLIISEFRSAVGTDLAVDTLALDAMSLHPRFHRARASQHAAAVDYDSVSVHGWVEEPRRPRQVIDRPLARPAFPASLLEHIIGLLPLEEGYEAQVALYDMWADANRWLGFESSSRLRSFGGDRRLPPGWFRS